MDKAYTLKKATLKDVEFLLNLRIATMEEHLIKAGIHLSMADHKERIFHNFEFAKIIMHQDESIGLLKVLEHPRDYEIEQIQIKKEYQGKGIGLRIIKDLIRKAEFENLPLKLSVLKNNKARFLYERLGFIKTGEDLKSYFMIRENGNSMS